MSSVGSNRVFFQVYIPYILNAIIISFNYVTICLLFFLCGLAVNVDADYHFAKLFIKCVCLFFLYRDLYDVRTAMFALYCLLI